MPWCEWGAGFQLTHLDPGTTVPPGRCGVGGIAVARRLTLEVIHDVCDGALKHTNNIRETSCGWTLDIVPSHLEVLTTPWTLTIEAAKVGVA